MFFLAPLPTYEETRVRSESKDAAGDISRQIVDCYAEFGYDVVVVPAVPVGERARFIREFIDSTLHRQDSAGRAKL